MATRVRKKKVGAKKNTVKKQYNRDFGMRSDEKIGIYLKEQGHTSLSRFLSDGKETYNSKK